MTESVEELLALLDRPEEQAAFLRRVTAESRRRERLASRVLLKLLIGEEPQVDYRPSGAPFLVVSCCQHLTYPRLCGCHLGGRTYRHRHRISFGSSPAHPFSLHDTRGGASHRPVA